VCVELWICWSGGGGATSNVDHTELRSDAAAMGLKMEVDGGENLAMVGSLDTELTEAAAPVISQPHSEVGGMAIPTTSVSGPPSKEENKTTTLMGPTTCLPKGDKGAVHQMFSEPCQRAKLLLEQLELENSHLTDIQWTQLESVLESYTDVFVLDSSELSTTSIVEHSINTGDHSPIRQPMRRMPFA